MRSTESSDTRSRFLVSPTNVLWLVFGKPFNSSWGRSSLSLVIAIASGLISTQMEFLPVSRHSTGVVPPPTIGSRTVSFYLEYSRRMFLTTSGGQFPRYWGVCDAHDPLFGKLHTVVLSVMNCSGPAGTFSVPLYSLHGLICLFSISTLLACEDVISFISEYVAVLNKRLAVAV